MVTIHDDEIDGSDNVNGTAAFASSSIQATVQCTFIEKEMKRRNCEVAIDAGIHCCM